MIKEVTLERVSKKEERTSKNGKTYTPVGIVVDKKWYNSAIYDKDELARLQEGARLTLSFYQSQGEDGKTFDNFRFPSRSDLLEQDVKKLKIFARTVCELYPEVAKKFKDHEQSA